MQLHRREWYCDICSKPFPQKKSFQEHIKAKHSELVTKGHIEAVTNRCERAIVTNIICPLCGIELTFQTLEKHLGLHLQEVALFALPRPVPDEGSNGSKAMNLGHPSECSSEYLSRRLSIDSDSDGKQPGGDQPIISLPAIEGIRCICSYQHDDGFLITCNQCDELQHGVCMGINKGNVPEVYKCSMCIPGAHTLDVEKAINIQEDFVKSTIQAQASKINVHTDVPPQTKATPGQEKVQRKIKDNIILELLKMLTPLEPLKRHQDIQLSRSENTGTWLLNLKSFRRWRDSDTFVDSHVFCCYGIPGSGKTVTWY